MGASSLTEVTFMTGEHNQAVNSTAEIIACNRDQNYHHMATRRDYFRRQISYPCICGVVRRGSPGPSKVKIRGGPDGVVVSGGDRLTLSNDSGLVKNLYNEQVIAATRKDSAAFRQYVLTRASEFKFCVFCFSENGNSLSQPRAYGGVAGLRPL